MDERVKSLLSLCQRAGLLQSGEFLCERALQKGTAKLVLIAADASDNTKKKFTNKARHYQTACVLYGDRDNIGAAIGKHNRASVVITDKNLADKILARITGDHM